MTYTQGLRTEFVHAQEEEAWGNLNAVSYYLTGEFREDRSKLFRSALRKNERQQALITRGEIPIRYWKICFHSEGGQTLGHVTREALDALSSGMLRTRQDTVWSTLI